MLGKHTAALAAVIVAGACLAAAAPRAAASAAIPIKITYTMPQGVDPNPIYFGFNGDGGDFTGSQLLEGVDFLVDPQRGVGLTYKRVSIDLGSAAMDGLSVEVETTRDPQFTEFTANWIPVPKQPLSSPIELLWQPGAGAIGDTAGQNRYFGEIRADPTTVPDGFSEYRFRARGYTQVPEPGAAATLVGLLVGAGTPLALVLRRRR